MLLKVEARSGADALRDFAAEICRLIEHDARHPFGEY